MRLAATTSLYLITDRRRFGEGSDALDRLVRLAGDAARAGIDMLQIRERDLEAAELDRLSRRVLDAVAGHPMRVLVSDRFDIALAAGLDGVHLTTRSMTASVVRRSVGRSLLIGASTHDDREIADAEQGADFAVCGPVFETDSKRGYGPPLGVERVAAIALDCSIPVLALGGITVDNARIVPRPPLAGIAAIGVFHDAWAAAGLDGLRAVAADLRAAV